MPATETEHRERRVRGRIDYLALGDAPHHRNCHRGPIAEVRTHRNVGGGGNEFTRQFEYQVEAAILDRAIGTTCSPAIEVDEVRITPVRLRPTASLVHG